MEKNRPLQPGTDFERIYGELIAEGMSPEAAKRLAEQSTTHSSDGDVPARIPDGKGGFYIVDHRNPWED